MVETSIIFELMLLISWQIFFHLNANFTLMLKKRLQLELLIVPQIPYLGSAPGPLWLGTPVSQTLWYVPATVETDRRLWKY